MSSEKWFDYDIIDGEVSVECKDCYGITQIGKGDTLFLSTTLPFHMDTLIGLTMTWFTASINARGHSHNADLR